MSDKLEGVKLTSRNFEEVIAMSPKGSFIFVDPPYSLNSPKTKTTKYKYPFRNIQHKRLLEALKFRSNDIKFILTYRLDETAMDLYKPVGGLHKNSDI